MGHVLQNLTPEQLEAAINVAAQIAEQQPHQRVPAEGIELSDEVILPVGPIATNDVCFGNLFQEAANLAENELLVGGDERDQVFGSGREPRLQRSPIALSALSLHQR